MKKVIIAVILIAAIGGYAYWSSTKPAATAVANDPTNSTSAPSETTNPASGSTATSGTYKDGTYKGSVADAFYGNLQVSATISGGKLTAVTFLQFPDDQGESKQVNAHSNPILVTEAIAAQNAQVDIVSGATQSSEAFQQSLGSALSQAKA